MSVIAMLQQKANSFPIADHLGSMKSSFLFGFSITAYPRRITRGPPGAAFAWHP